MSDNCPKCGFELKDFYTKKIETELKQKFDEKQKKMFGDLNEELEAEKLKNSVLEKKSKQNEELLKEKIKTDLSSEFSEKELSYQKHQIKLEGKISELERNKKTQIEVTVAAKLQQQKSELFAEFGLEKTEQSNEIKRLKKLIEDLESKSSQGSQQAQGEAGEILIENSIRNAFPNDLVEEVAKGVNGADVCHYVRDNSERDIGLIYIESKNAKNFSPSWVSKLKEDMKNKKANYGILVTLDIPENVKVYEEDDLFICGFHDYMLAVKLLRVQLFEIEKTKILEVNRNDKSAMIYDYVTGREFAQWVRGMMDYMREQRDHLEKDMRHYVKSMETRRKQIEKMETSNLTLIGHFKGLGSREDFTILEDMTSED